MEVGRAAKKWVALEIRGGDTENRLRCVKTAETESREGGEVALQKKCRPVEKSIASESAAMVMAVTIETTLASESACPT